MGFQLISPSSKKLFHCIQPIQSGSPFCLLTSSSTRVCAKNNFFTCRKKALCSSVLSGWFRVTFALFQVVLKRKFWIGLLLGKQYPPSSLFYLQDHFPGNRMPASCVLTLFPGSTLVSSLAHIPKCEHTGWGNSGVATGDPSVPSLQSSQAGYWYVITKTLASENRELGKRREGKGRGSYHVGSEQGMYSQPNLQIALLCSRQTMPLLYVNCTHINVIQPCWVTS